MSCSKGENEYEVADMVVDSMEIAGGDSACKLIQHRVPLARKTAFLEVTDPVLPKSQSQIVFPCSARTLGGSGSAYARVVNVSKEQLSRGVAFRNRLPVSESPLAGARQSLDIERKDLKCTVDAVPMNVGPVVLSPLLKQSELLPKYGWLNSNSEGSPRHQSERLVVGPTAKRPDTAHPSQLKKNHLLLPIATGKKPKQRSIFTVAGEASLQPLGSSSLKK